MITLNNEDKQFAMLEFFDVLEFFAMFLMYFFVHVDLENVGLVCSLTVLIGGQYFRALLPNNVFKHGCPIMFL